MTQFAVIHITKGSGNGSALGNHIDRIETLTPEGESKNNFNNADPERRHLNDEFAQDKFINLSLAQAVSLRIKEGYHSKKNSGELKQIAKGAVKFVEVNLSGSNERMKEIESDPDELKKWIKANLDFVNEKYGKENIVRFSLHLDETTPHIHCVFVPLTPDGRLSAKEIIGNNAALKSLQNDYAAAMKPLKLERGIDGSFARHTGKQEYIKKFDESTKEVEELVVKGILGVNKDKTIEKLKSVLTGAKTSLKLEVDKKKRIQEAYNTYKTENSRLLKELKESKEKNRADIISNYKEIKSIIYNPQEFLKQKKYYDKVEQEAAEKKRILEEKAQHKTRKLKRD